VTPELLRRIGEALYGPRWGAADFQADIGGGERKIRRWVSGKESIPSYVGPELLVLCKRLAAELFEIIKELEALPPDRGPPSRIDPVSDEADED
jgi:hypothetical protein